MKKIVLAIFAFVIGAFMLGINIEAADYNVKVSKSYKNGYTYVTLKPSGGTLYYTTDGTKADKSDNKYTEKIKITEPLTIRMTIYEGDKIARRCSAKIDVRTAKPEVSVKELKDNKYQLEFSADDKAAIYYTTNGDTPTQENGKKLGKSKKITVDGGTEVKAIAVKKGWKDSKVLIEKLADKSLNTFAEEVLRLINIERRNHGLAEFVTTEAHNKAAEIRANEITQKFGSKRPDGTPYAEVLKECGIKFTRRSENLAAGYKTPEKVVSSWMSSTQHRDNILNPKYTRTGIGFVETNAGYHQYWVQMFTD